MNKILRKVLCGALLCFTSGVAFAAESDVMACDFSNGATMEGWTVADMNGDGVTWAEQEGLKGAVYNGFSTLNPAEDWLFTPAFATEAGKHYIVSYTIAQRGAFDADNIAIYCGDAATAEAMTTHLVTEKYDNHAGKVVRYCHIASETSGSQVLGFKLTSPAGNGYVLLKSISVSETEGQCPQAALDMDVTMDGNAKTVKVRWISPKRDVKGVAISGKMKALIYQDSELVATVDDVVPGDTAQYVYSPSVYLGKHTYSLAFQADKVSESVSQEVDLEDVQGQKVLMHAFPMTKTDVNDSWVIENKNGGETWSYYAGSVYISAIDKSVNDWLITPKYGLVPGRRYVLTYKLATSRDYPATVEVTYGNKQASSGQTNVIAKHTDLCQNGFADFESVQFEVSTAGVYYFGFHATYVGNSVDVKDVKLYYVEAGEAPEERPLTYVEPAETIIPDNDNPDLTETRAYDQRLSMEGVELTAVFTQAQVDQYTLAPKGFYAVQHYNGKYKVSLRNPVFEADFGGGCVYHEGKLYCNEYNFQSDYQFATPVWKVLDAKTFETISADTLNTNCENTTIAMAYDPTSDKMYGFVRDYVDTWLVEINPENGQMKRLAPNAMDYWKRYVAMACDHKGNLYAIYMTEDYKTGEQKHFFCRINKDNGQIADIGEIQVANMLPEDLLVNMKYHQSLFYNNNTKKLYWMLCSSSMAIGGQYAPMFEIDPVNCRATLLTYLEDVYAISGAYFNEPNLLAPGVISDFKYTQTDLNLAEGTISFKLPSVSYDGTEMTSMVKYSVKELQGTINIEGQAAAGSVVELKVSSTQGIHNLEIQLSNEAGEGPVVTRTFLIGYDMPSAPMNVNLTDENLTTTLTWSRPVVGTHGAEFDASKLKFDVVRYPEELTVASGITDTVFVENHGSDLLRYYYVVYSCCDTLRTAGVVSNAVVVGAPINPPYGGVFEGVADMYNYYTILDVNKDEYTWSLDTETGAAFYPYNWAQGANDWMISPPIRFDAGAPYQLVFSTFSSSALYPESMLVTLGKGKTPEAQTEVLLDLPSVPAQEDDGSIATYTLDFTVPETGVYYYGFKAYSVAYQEYLFLYDIQLNGTTGVESIVTKQQNFDAYAQGGAINVLNPENDVISVYTVSGVLVAQVEESTAKLNVVPGIYIVKSSKNAIKVAVQ